ncbi:2-succinyl-6-hydroxy-2,4-cyclohexadiene-1-carboxylate synthase [Rhodohalobacter mucosus]|uniref:2-succinyl-6-hydroxy-2,4-cyclohexadiene-1-carboxylate synthase n=1 Tax=Rhodohalobacter mucosus TaxID=2079485 RepID=A0A316TTP5_9BACT|nr:2-succinyl-6-hydroxy-2,4-cyclohexadiene-1-carboxylate synthase [Rhodohalobacter mucosus]PWN07001.1 2-succinyl-6-hydroxy-2,4-cyclohexadiene-1-carboxylate synthase [Rhodohalobacter mucosus]
MIAYSEGIGYNLDYRHHDSRLPVLLMMHGFMGSGAAFRQFAERLSNHCNPLLIDLAGHGHTKTPAKTELFKTSRQVSQLRSVLSRFRFEKLIGYGYSMGGRLLIQLAVKHPGLFSGLFIESSHCGLESEKQRALRRQKDEERARSIETDFQSFVDRWLDLPLFSQTPDHQKEVYRTIMLAQDPALLACSLRGFGTGSMPSVCDQLQRLRSPLYLMAGEQDRKYVHRMSAMSKNCNDCSLHIVQKAGHRAHADCPEEIINIIKHTLETRYHV